MSKYAHLADAIAVCHDFDTLYPLVNGQGRQIKNLLVQPVLRMLNKLLVHNLPPYSAPLNCSILCSGSRPL